MLETYIWIALGFVPICWITAYILCRRGAPTKIVRLIGSFAVDMFFSIATSFGAVYLIYSNRSGLAILGFICGILYLFLAVREYRKLNNLPWAPQ